MNRSTLPFRPRASVLALEPRVLFDGAGAVAAAGQWYDDPEQALASFQPAAVAAEAPASAPLLGALEAKATEGAQEGGAPLYELGDAALLVDSAVTMAHASMSDFIAGTSPVSLAAMFDGGQGHGDAQRIASAEALRQDILAGAGMSRSVSATTRLC